jgi:hypothetical protein
VENLKENEKWQITQKRIRARTRGNRVNNPDNSNRKIHRMFQRRTLLRKAIRSRAIGRGHRTRAANAALPKLRNSDLGPGPSRPGPLFYSELIELLTLWRSHATRKLEKTVLGRIERPV